jgi:hypothetical protein
LAHVLTVERVDGKGNHATRQRLAFC